MPRIIDYPDVLQQLTHQGLVCNYHNSGAFGFARGADALVRGWIGPADSTIRPELLAQVLSVPAPYEKNLAQAAARVWRHVLPGVAWLMPMSHWHFELHDGSREWMPTALHDIGLDAKDLLDRNNGSALEFLPAEADSFCRLVEALLTNLNVSDFMLAFPFRQVLCMVHHHKQLWWMTTDEDLAGRLDSQIESRS